MSFVLKVKNDYQLLVLTNILSTEKH